MNYVYDYRHNLLLYTDIHVLHPHLSFPPYIPFPIFFVLLLILPSIPIYPILLILHFLLLFLPWFGS
jgi:hypothetical protein